MTQTHSLWARTFYRALRRGLDPGYAAWLADRAQDRAREGETMHKCEPGHNWLEGDGAIFASGGFGAAIDICYETDDRSLICANSEYATRVNYCPFCGYEAPNKVQWRPAPETGA